MMITVSLLILHIFLCDATAANIYGYNMISEVIPYYEDILSGFRDVNNTDFVIGGLFPVYDCTAVEFTIGQHGLEWLEAMLFAIDRINNDLDLLPNLTIGYDVRDTCNDSVVGLDETLNIIRLAEETYYPLVGIVGPAATSVSLTIASVTDLHVPLVGYASSNAALSNKHLYKYFLRTIPSDTLQSNAMIDLVLLFEWEYVSVIFNDDTYGEPEANVFMDKAKQRRICIDVQISLPPSEISGIKSDRNIEKAVQTLLSSTAFVVIAYTDEATIIELFEELSRMNSTHKFVWVASERWANSPLVRDKFPEIANRTFGFLSQRIKRVKEFADYFSQLAPLENIRDPFFGEFYEAFCQTDGSGTDCPNDLTNESSYSQGDVVPFVVDAVYAIAHALQNFLHNNCNSPLNWNRTTQQCEGMKRQLIGENLLDYLFNVTFNGIQNRTISFDENGDPLEGVFEIVNLQMNNSGEYEYVPIGYWNSVNGVLLNDSNEIEKVVSRCSEPCSEGMIRSITNPNCPSCFECISCVGPMYSLNSSATSCSLCADNHWGNNPLLGSTHCVPVLVRHLDFSSGWSIVSMCIASIALIVLAIITVIFVMTWKTPIVKSSGREQMVMLIIGIAACCALIYVIVSPPSIAVCAFQRIGIWLCFSLAFGALLVKIIRVARIFYSIRSSVRKPPFTDPVYQVIFTVAIVLFQFILVVVGLILDPPYVKRDPDMVKTSSAQQTGNAPVIVETCQQPHTAILVLSLVYNSAIIIGCTILGWMTRSFPENFNEARHVMFTSFTLIVVWVLFVPLYFYTEDEFQAGVFALGVVLSAVALISGVFFPRVFIIIFRKHKNTKEYAARQQHGSPAANSNKQTRFSKALQQSKRLA